MEERLRVCLTIKERRVRVGKQRDVCDVRPFGMKGEQGKGGDWALFSVQLRVEAKGDKEIKQAEPCTFL